MSILTSLISVWKLNESSGNAADAAASNTLTNSSSVTYGGAKLANGAYFVSTDSDALSITDGAQTGLNLTTDFSVCFWVKFTVLPTDTNIMSLFSKRNAPNGYSLYVLNTSGTYSWQCQIQTGTANINDTITTNTFYFITFVYTKSTGTVKIYRNASLIGTTSAIDTNLSVSDQSFRLGNDGSMSTRYLDGVLDEVAIWARVLTAPEITQLYNAGSGTTYPYLQIASVSESTALSDAIIGFKRFITTLSDSLAGITDKIRAGFGITNTTKSSSSWNNTLKS